jgi:hypothetical protein
MKNLPLFCLLSICFTFQSAYAGLDPSQVCRELSFKSAKEECAAIVAYGSFSDYGVDLCIYIAEQSPGSSMANRCLRAIKDRIVSSADHRVCKTRAPLSGIVDCLEGKNLHMSELNTEAVNSSL